MNFHLHLHFNLKLDHDVNIILNHQLFLTHLQ